MTNQTYVKAKSIMTLMLVAASANRAKTPAASFAHLWGERKNLWGEIIFVLIVSNIIGRTWNKLFAKP